VDDSHEVKKRTAVEIALRLKRGGYEAFFVGGAVRDYLRGVTPGDYDIVTSAKPEQVAELFERTADIGARFGVTAVISGGNVYEVATFRSDEAYKDGRRPVQVRYSTAREDVCRRDFTVNGLLMDPESGQIIDYVNGTQDIEKKIIRTIGDPYQRFGEDYLRMLRALRFAANLNFSIEQDTKDAIVAHGKKIRGISAERVAEELDKILTRGGARRGFELLSATGLLRHILPEVENLKGVGQPPRYHPEGDVWEHTMIMLEVLAAETAPRTNATLAWAALLHDAGKPATRTVDEKGVHFYGHTREGERIAAEIAARLKFSRARRDGLVALIHHHMAFMNVQKMRPARLKRFLRMPDFDLHLQLHRLDCLASHGMLDHYEFCRAELSRAAPEELRPVRLLTGDDLMAMGYAPGRLIGEILRRLEDEQLESRIKTRGEAEAFVRHNWGL
jgi:poly(A) polymerase